MYLVCVSSPSGVMNMRRQGVPTVKMHEAVMRNATRCADLVRIADGAHVLSNELLEQGYTDCWYAYQHAATQVRRLKTRGQYEAAGRWLERRDSYGTARRAIWAEMVHRGLRSEAPLVGPRLTAAHD